MADVRTIYFHTENGGVFTWKCERSANVSLDANLPYCTWPCIVKNVVRIVDGSVEYTMNKCAPCVALYINPELEMIIHYVLVPYDDSKIELKSLSYTRFSRFNGGLQHLYVPRCYAVPLNEEAFDEHAVSMLNRGKLSIVARNVSVRKQPIMLNATAAPPANVSNSAVTAAFPKAPLPLTAATANNRRKPR